MTARGRCRTWGVGLAVSDVRRETGQAHMMPGNYESAKNGGPSVWLL